jgi:hypothetical protein
MQAGNAAACAFGPSVERLPTGPKTTPKRLASPLRRGLRRVLRNVPSPGLNLTT